VCDREHRRISANYQCNEENGCRAETWSGPKNSPTETHILEELLDGGRDPHRPRVFFGDGDISKCPLGRYTRFFGRFAPFSEKLSLLSEMKANLVVEIAVILRTANH
jgi:hypothetical protein